MASGASDFLINSMIDHVFRDISYEPASTIYVALCTTTPAATDTGTGIAAGVNYSPTPTGVEVSGGSYARVAYNPSSSSNWTATQGGVSGASSGSSEMTQNSTAIIFPICSSGWGTVNGMALCDNDLTTLTNKTFTHNSAVVNLADTTGLRENDPVFLDDGSGNYLTTYIVSIITNTSITLNDVWTASTTTVGTLIDGGNILYFGDLTAPRTVATSDIFDFASSSLQVVLNCS